MSKTVLCIDDSETIQRVCEICVKGSEWTYQGAKTADEGIAMANSIAPALVLVDANLPVKSGYEVAKLLSGVAPVAVLCGNSSPYNETAASASGVVGQLKKPWDVKTFMEKIEEYSKAAVAAAAPPPAAIPASPPAAARNMTMMGIPQQSIPPLGGAAPQAPAPTAPPVAAKPVRSPLGGIPGIPKIATPPPVAQPAMAPPPVASLDLGAPGPSAEPTIELDLGAGGVTEVPSGQPTGLSAATPPPASAPVTRPPSGLGAATSKPAAAPPRRAPMFKAAAAKPASAPVPSGPSTVGLGSLGKAPPPAGAPAVSQVAASVQGRVAQVAQEVGLEPNSPEMQAVVKLSQQVIERIAWEVVPQLAEVIIRENIDKFRG